MKKIIIAVVFVAIVAGAALFMFPRTGTSPSPQIESQPEAITSDVPLAATITYTNDGFTPKDLRVKVGDIINVVNTSSRSLQFSSDPHPIHTKNPELNAQTISAGASVNVTVTAQGTFGFHDHLDSTKTGTLVVE